MELKDFILTAIVILALVITSVGCRGGDGTSTSTANSQTPSAKVINELRKLTEAQCGTKAEAIDLDAPLETQGCDELDVVELIMTVEEKYNITISDDELQRATINKLARAINKR